MTQNVKVVMRHLPKHITEAEVLEVIGELPKEVLSYYFSPADLSFESLAFSTMYFVFSSFCDALFEFEKRFDNYIFIDSKGVDSMCNIELAVYQNHSKRNNEEMKKDSKCGKVTEEAYFKTFMKKLEEAENTPIMTLEQQILRLGRGEDAKTRLEKLDTPLVKFIYNEQIERQVHRRALREAKRTTTRNDRPINGLEPITARRPSGNATGRERNDEERKKRPMDPAKLERKRLRDALRKQKFLEKKALAEAERAKQPGISQGQREKREREPKKKEYPKPPRNYRGIREAPKLGDHIGNDW